MSRYIHCYIHSIVLLAYPMIQTQEFLLIMHNLMQQLEEIRRRKKDLRKKKRKDELKEEINRKLAELADLEESEADKNHRKE